MVQLLVMTLCGWLGWRRDEFFRWPLAIIAFATIATLAFVYAGHHEGAGPPLADQLVRFGVSAVIFPVLVYCGALLIRIVVDRRRE